MTFAIILTWPKLVFTVKTLIFSRTVDKNHTKMFQNDEIYKHTLKTSTFSIESLLIFLKKHIICNHTNLA